MVTAWHKTKAATGKVAARVDVESTETSDISQMKLLRRARYSAPIAEKKRNSAGRNHLAIQDTSRPAALQPFLISCRHPAQFTTLDPDQREGQPKGLRATKWPPHAQWARPVGQSFAVSKSFAPAARPAPPEPCANSAPACSGAARPPSPPRSPPSPAHPAWPSYPRCECWCRPPR